MRTMVQQTGIDFLRAALAGQDEGRDLQAVVQGAYDYAKGWLGEGELASFIPQLTRVEPDRLAVSVTTADGRRFSVGDTRHRFTIQSILKPIMLALGMRHLGFEELFSHMGMEPTGDPFNSLLRLETSARGIPMNPMINAGAIMLVSCLPGSTKEERFGTLLDFCRDLLGNPSLTWDEETCQSEFATADRNRAIAYMMRSRGVFQGDVDWHLEVLFRACAIQVNCEELGHFGAVLANGGVSPSSGERLLSAAQTRAVCSIMTTCGMYDFSGEFATRVGVPAKSGVGGGIAGAVPGRMGIGTFSPRLDLHGNSVCGIKAMEHLSEHLELSIFGL